MSKRLAVAAAMTAAFAFGIVGTASAGVGTTCPTNAEAGPVATGTSLVPKASLPSPGLAGSVQNVGYGQAYVNTTTLGYSGTLNGPGIGYGDIDARVIGGPSGEADGEVDGVVAASGNLDSNLEIQTETAAGCISITVP